MAVGIGRSIGAGFRAANKSWAGIGVVIGIWIAIVVVSIVGIGLTNPPAGVADQAGLPVGDLVSPPVDTTLVETEESEITEEPAPALSETAETVAPPAPETPANATQDREEQIRAVREWMGRAWPIVLIGVLLYLAVGTWLFGGQVGYLAKRVLTQQSSLSEFWAAGARAFWPLLRASLLMLAAFGALALVVWGGTALGAAMPGWLLAILVVILWVGLIWVSIRLALWLIAIVVDRTGPIGGLRASLRATRGHWWRLFGLVVLWVLISFGVQLPFGLLQELGNVTGGALALIAGFISTVAGGIANVYITFASLAALIRFYEDTKAA